MAKFVSAIVPCMLIIIHVASSAITDISNRPHSPALTKIIDNCGKPNTPDMTMEEVGICRYKALGLIDEKNAPNPEALKILLDNDSGHFVESMTGCLKQVFGPAENPSASYIMITYCLNAMVSAELSNPPEALAVLQLIVDGLDITPLIRRL